MDNQRLLGFLFYWLFNTIALILLSLIFKNNVVLGNAKIAMGLAGVFCGLIITVSGMALEMIAKKMDLIGGVKSTFSGTPVKIKDEAIWAVYFLIVNILVVWIIKRLTLFIGFGVSSLTFVLIVGAVLTIFQWAAFAISGFSKKK